jgi:hypothetical protein
VIAPEPIVLTSAALTDASVDAAPDPCTVMRKTGDDSESSNRLSLPHLRPPSVERAIRKFYVREVMGRGIDDRSPSKHPLVFERGVVADAPLVAACVDEWRVADPDGVVPGGSGRFIAEHRYVEVNFEFNDASDGENGFTVFVDVKTLDVVAAFRWDNFQP